MALFSSNENENHLPESLLRIIMMIQNITIFQNNNNRDATGQAKPNHSKKQKQITSFIGHKNLLQMQSQENEIEREKFIANHLKNYWYKLIIDIVNVIPAPATFKQQNEKTILSIPDETGKTHTHTHSRKQIYKQND